MIPDYSVELCFRNDYRDVVQQRLGKLCDPEYADQICARPFGADKWDAEICLLGPSDVSPDLLADFRKLSDDSTSCGLIDFEYAPEGQYVVIPDCFSIELWPRTRRLQFIFFSSMEFRAALVELLQDCGGRNGAIVYDSCLPIGFWSPEAGRYNDDRPEQSSGKLLVPSELKGE